jgi:hypothetical protein
MRDTVAARTEADFPDTLQRKVLGVVATVKRF